MAFNVRQLIPAEAGQARAPDGISWAFYPAEQRDSLLLARHVQHACGLGKCFRTA
jgi:hypothetical protein